MTAGTKPGSEIQVFTGRVFDPLNPDPEMITIEDIAHSLATQTRYQGHCGRAYSVAEHSVHVSRACEPEDAMWGLLHDGPEFGLGDWPSPLKRSPVGEGFRAAESVLMLAICKRFGLDPVEPESVSRADKAMLERERKVVFAHTTPESEAFWAGWKEAIPEMDDSWLPEYTEPQWWPAEIAEQLFLQRFMELGGQ